jgi:UDP-glucuronate decarboxylase
VNLGNQDEFTILELAEKVIEPTGAKSNIVYEPLPADDPRHRRPNIDLAKKHIGWEPKVKLEESIGRTNEYFERLMRVHWVEFAVR